MNTLSKLGLAIAGTVAISSAATVLNPGEAYAATLTGGFSFSGLLSGVNTGVNPGNDTFNFGPLSSTGTEGTGDFFGVTITSLISSLTIARDIVTDGSNADGITSALYTYEAIPNFFALSNGYTFALDAGIVSRTRFQNGPGNVFVSIGGLAPLNGRFIDANGEVVGFGSLSFTGVPGGSGTYGVSLTTEEIPTPALLPGLLGLGAMALRRKDSETAEENA